MSSSGHTPAWAPTCQHGAVCAELAPAGPHDGVCKGPAQHGSHPGRAPRKRRRVAAASRRRVCQRERGGEPEAVLHGAGDRCGRGRVEVAGARRHGAAGAGRQAGRRRAAERDPLVAADAEQQEGAAAGRLAVQVGAGQRAHAGHDARCGARGDRRGREGRRCALVLNMEGARVWQRRERVHPLRLLVNSGGARAAFPGSPCCTSDLIVQVRYEDLVADTKHGPKFVLLLRESARVTARQCSVSSCVYERLFVVFRVAVPCGLQLKLWRFGGCRRCCARCSVLSCWRPAGAPLPVSLDTWPCRVCNRVACNVTACIHAAHHHMEQYASRTPGCDGLDRLCR